MRLRRLFRNGTLRNMTLLLMAGATLGAAAQETETLGFVNAYIHFEATPANGGKVWISEDGKGLPSYKASYDYKGTLEVAWDAVYLEGNTRDGEGSFVGWYIDDGDGVFDREKDLMFSTSASKAILELPAWWFTADGGYDYYPTKAEALAATQPTSPQVTVWAYFSKGATIDIDYHNAYMGSVSVSNEANEPGDVITVTAEPLEGYQFEHWKTIRGPRAGQADKGIVSHDNPYTFTVQGKEHLYAVFSHVDAPVIEFPQEGGWKVIRMDAPWVMHDETDNAKAHLFNTGDLYVEDGNVFLNADYDIDEEDYDPIHYKAQYFNDWRNEGDATVIYGKGTVRFDYIDNVSGSYLNHTREGSMVRWNGSNAKVVKDPDNAACYHFYTFDEARQAFIEFATTDYITDIDAPDRVTIPANTSYIQLSAFDLMASDLGTVLDNEMPTIIALSPKAFEPFEERSTDIERAEMQIHEGQMGGLKVYTLSGMKIRATSEPGIYIMNGRKVVVR